MQTGEDGLCACGCGEVTPIAKRSYGTFLKGSHYRFCAGHQRRKSPLEYVVDTETGCWNWQRAKSAYGYGVISVGGKNAYAHRVFYERAHGSIPKGMKVHHRCENPNCVNPDHLETVTHADNIQRSKRSRLSHDDIRAIRAAAGTVSHRIIGERFGISDSTVWQIIHRVTWKDIT